MQIENSLKNVIIFENNQINAVLVHEQNRLIKTNLKPNLLNGTVHTHKH